MSAQVLGTPAVHARSLRSAALRRAAVLLGAVLAGSGLALRLLSSDAPAALVAVPVAVALAAGIALAASRERLARLQAGIGAEDAVARRLRRLPVTAVVHNAQLGAGDIDHVILGPCLVAVETKYGRGPMQEHGGRLLVRGRALPRDPLAQARANAQKVARATGAPCTPVVVISQGEGPALSIGGVWVCSPGQLPGLVAQLPAVLSQQAAATAAQRLAAGPPH